MPKQRRWVQKKLTFETYIKHYALGPDPEVERQKERERQLKEIHQRLEEARIAYEPKGIKKKEMPDLRFKNGKYCPWGNLPEMYPGQHKGKSPDYAGKLLQWNGKDITNVYDTVDTEQQQKIYENLKTYINLHDEDAAWDISPNVKALWNRISEK